MRRLAPRPELSADSSERLRAKAALIAKGADSKATALQVYESSRGTGWFGHVTRILKQISGPGERCMFCSGSECSQVEHFRPKAVFPLEAMNWENFLWVCGICNQKKGNRFPPSTEPGAAIINPLEEDVWEFFFIDEFGNLTERWRPDLNGVDPRAHSTVRIVGLDRDALQQTRQSRLDDLKQKARDALTLFENGHIGAADLRERVDVWVQQPFQPDIADFFLRGPGRAEQPFSALLANIDE